MQTFDIRSVMSNSMTSAHSISATILGTVCGLLSVSTERKGLLSVSSIKLVEQKTSYTEGKLYKELTKITGRFVHISRILRGDAVLAT